jgi:lactate dehydrogenase-like 2-hydroxyacid dehydrogenase
MKIVFLDAATLGADVDKSVFRKLGEYVSYDHTAHNQIVERLCEAQVAITNKVILDAEILSQLPNLKLICVAATGTNNIDLEYAKNHNLIVRNAVNYSTMSVAQHTFTMLFALMGNIAWHDEYVKNGSYAKSLHFTNLDKPYFELQGKTFGIIGLGNIGRKVAEIATCFGANVIYAPISGKSRNEAYKEVAFDELLSVSDVVSVHSPLNDLTRNLFSASKIALMKPSSILVNVGRGGIVDEQALAFALDNNKIGGACVDVFSKEPIENTNPLLHVVQKHKLVMTPHTAWASKEARTKLIEIIAKNIEMGF